MNIITPSASAGLLQGLAERQLARALRELAANLILTANGSGRPGAVREQVFAFIAAMQSCKDATGTWPSPDLIETALQAEVTAAEGSHPAWASFDDLAVRSALKLTAAALQGVPLEAARARTELHAAFYQLEQSRAERRPDQG